MLLTLLILSLILNALLFLVWQRADWRALVAERRMVLAERDLATALGRQNELGRRCIELQQKLEAPPVERCVPAMYQLPIGTLCWN